MVTRKKKLNQSYMDAYEETTSITKIQYSGLPIDPNVLATLLDVSSTQKTKIRWIHCSSTCSNNQGQNPSPSSFSSTTGFAVSWLVNLHLWVVMLIYFYFFFLCYYSGNLLVLFLVQLRWSFYLSTSWYYRD